MPETDWYALDRQIAAEVMGFTREDVYGARALFWVSRSGITKYLVERPDSYAWMDWDVWQPHKKVAQALMALDVLVKRGVDVSIYTWHHDPNYTVWMVPAERRRPSWVDYHAKYAKALCLAIRSCLDGRGMSNGAAS